MNQTFTQIATALKTMAPTLATMLGGPLAGTAVAALEGALGVSPGSGPDSITQVIQNGALTPDQIASVRAADQHHAEIMAQQNIDLLKMNQDHDLAFLADVKSARDMQIATHSPMPAILTTMVTIGFFSILGVMLYGVKATDNQALLILLGSLGTGWAACLNYWVGTTRGSTDKNNLLAQSSPAK